MRSPALRNREAGVCARAPLTLPCPPFRAPPRSEEILARGGNIIVVTESGNTDFDGRCEAKLEVPVVAEWLSPLLTVVPLQLLSYYIADYRKADVDQPRNLAKSVTVE